VDSPITPNDLKNLLSSLALSRGELADLLSVSKSTVDGWCSNKSIGKKRQ
jgi:DNA-binding transcriptional regulator YiaG